ncbi:MAG: hypothetical protein LBE06_01545 [Azoarcus sp.]|jgi:hypothetical protein|nr:hypothetical protein [Azoarcus sp.]
MTAYKKSTWAVFAIVLAFAAFLRVQQIDIQWLTDDEWHAVYKATSGVSYGDIATAVGVADFSIPQTLLYKWLAAHGGVDELGMRLPMLAAGLLLVAGGGWWAWRNFGAAAGLGFMSLLAISPLLVNYSRNARPYALTVLLAWGALLALARWRRQCQWRWAWGYAASASLACWLHMAVAPFVLAPLAWIAMGDAWQAWKTRNWAILRPSCLLGLGMAAAVALLAGLPMLMNTATLSTRMGKDLPTLATWIGVWFCWLGVDSRLLMLLCVLLALPGALALYRRRADVFGLACAGVLATLAAIYCSRPAWVQNPLTFGRYLLPVLPPLLLCVTLGTQRLLERWLAKLPVVQARVAWALVFTVLAGLLLADGPALELLERPNNFTLHSWHQFDYRVRHNPVRTLLNDLPESPFWRRLAELPPGSVRLAVAGHGLESFTLADARWQRIHRQPLWSAQRTGYCGKPPYWGETDPASGFLLKNAVSLADPASLRRAAIDYVVFDRWAGNRPETEIDACIARFAREYGAPEYEDANVAAFRLTPAP